MAHGRQLSVATLTGVSLHSLCRFSRLSVGDLDSARPRRVLLPGAAAVMEMLIVQLQQQLLSSFGSLCYIRSGRRVEQSELIPFCRAE
jgi:hypothetical protein